MKKIFFICLALMLNACVVDPFYPSYGVAVSPGYYGGSHYNGYSHHGYGGHYGGGHYGGYRGGYGGFRGGHHH